MYVVGTCCYNHTCIHCLQEFVEIGGVQVRASKLSAAKGKKCPYKMGRALLQEFFTPEELKTCSTVPARTKSQAPRQTADEKKLHSLLRKFFSIINYYSYLHLSLILSSLSHLGLSFTHICVHCTFYCKHTPIMQNIFCQMRSARHTLEVLTCKL